MMIIDHCYYVAIHMGRIMCCTSSVCPSVRPFRVSDFREIWKP